VPLFPLELVAVNHLAADQNEVALGQQVQVKVEDHELIQDPENSFNLLIALLSAVIVNA